MYNCSLKRILRLSHVILYILVLLVALPALIIISIKREVAKEEKTALIGGIFVILTLPVSIGEITMHMVYYSRPSLQKHVIRILWMVPIYALNGWLGLVYSGQGIYVDSARECYEAYVIYNFQVYLFNYLNEEMDLEINLALKPQVRHYFPLCWLPNWKMGRELVHNCKHGILQYTVVRPLTTAVAFICEQKGCYGEGVFRWNVAFPYILAVNNVSQFIAMYCLVLFYKANREELRPMEPIGKFVCIKAVVFFSFFQSVLIYVATSAGLLGFTAAATENESVTSISNKVQNFLICIEMFIAAVAHHYVFSYNVYVNDLVEKRTLCDAFMAMWDVSDVQADIKEHFGVVEEMHLKFLHSCVKKYTEAAYRLLKYPDYKTAKLQMHQLCSRQKKQSLKSQTFVLGYSISNINKQLRGQSTLEDGLESASLISPSEQRHTTYNTVQA